MIIFASLQILYQYKSLTPSKSMPQKNNHDFKEIRQNASKTHKDIKFGKEVKTILVIALYFLT